MQGKLPVRCVRAVEEILPECLCARRQRPDRHHLVEVAELRDEARHRFLGHRNTPFIKWIPDAAVNSKTGPLISKASQIERIVGPLICLARQASPKIVLFVGRAKECASHRC